MAHENERGDAERQKRISEGNKRLLEEINDRAFRKDFIRKFLNESGPEFADRLAKGDRVKKSSGPAK